MHPDPRAAPLFLPRRRRVGGLGQGAEGGSDAGRDICLQELLPGWAKPDVSFSRPSPPAPAFLETWSSAFPRLPPRGIGYSVCSSLRHSHSPPPTRPALCPVQPEGGRQETSSLHPQALQSVFSSSLEGWTNSTPSFNKCWLTPYYVPILCKYLCGQDRDTTEWRKQTRIK